MKTWSDWSATNFWWFWGASAVIGAVAFCFFASLCTRGVVSSANLLPWCAILLVLAGVIGGSLWLRSTGHEKTAVLPLLALIVPVILTLVGTLLFSAFYFLVFAFGNGRMN